MSRWKTVLPWLACLTLGGCRDVVGPASHTSDIFEVRVAVLPATVPRSDSATVRATVVNRTATDQRYGAGMGCFYFLESYRRTLWGLDRLILDGTSYACIAVGTSVLVPAADSVFLDHQFRASVGGRPAPTDDYVMRVRFNSSTPDLETSFRIR